MPDPFGQGADDWLAAAGSLGTYHSLSHGDFDDVYIVIEREIDVVDDGGAFSKKSAATIRSGLVTPAKNDTITLGVDNWRVEAKESDDGYLQRLFVRPSL